MKDYKLFDEKQLLYSYLSTFIKKFNKNNLFNTTRVVCIVYRICQISAFN